MTKDDLEARRKVYQDQLVVAQHDALKSQQFVQQLHGAIADCDYWLGELAKADPGGVPSPPTR